MQVGNNLSHLRGPLQKLLSPHDIIRRVPVFDKLLDFLTFDVLVDNDDCLFVDIFAPVVDKLYHFYYLGVVYLGQDLFSVGEF